MDNMVVEVEATCVEVEVDVVRNSKYSYIIIVGIRDRKKKILALLLNPGIMMDKVKKWKFYVYPNLIFIMSGANVDIRESEMKLKSCWIFRKDGE